MYKTYFKQAIQLLRQNPFISIISILGTALAIMMIMVIIISDNIKDVSVKPEINRSRSFYSYAFDCRDTVKKWQRSGPLMYEMVRDYYYKMQKPEVVTAFEFEYIHGYRQSVVQRESGGSSRKTSMRFVDAAFWRVFAFDFVQGVPFTQEEFDSKIRRAVISEAVARNFFKDENPVGKNVLIDNVSYNVAGVVKDVSPVFKMAYGDVWVPYTSKQGYDRSFAYMVAMLAKSSKDSPLIAEEIDEMSKRYSTSHAPEQMLFGAPWKHAHFDNSEAISSFGMSSEEVKHQQLVKPLRMALLFLVLLLIPAINLSGFSVSRMKKRTEEIGIRKAFGARTSTVLFQVMYENTITSLIGGLLGLILSYSTVFLLKGWILSVGSEAAIPLRTLVSPSIFLVVVLLCVLLSIVSSGIPALHAARMNIVKSISRHEGK